MPERYEPATFEEKWRQRWRDADLFLTREDPSRPCFYVLEFFPYPSGKGLSVGHCRNYVPSDVVARLKVMQGYNVLHPMGFDAFGLPAENEAISRKLHPAPMVQAYGENYRRQMELVGMSYDWSRSFYSSDPSYYKWTQWIFKLLFERGLAERRMAAVNWDPVEMCVLADEEVVAGRGWRSGALVEKKFIPQWFFKITDYAQRLIDDLDTVDWPDGIKEMQRNWIGRSEGVEFGMKVVVEGVTHSTHEDAGGIVVKRPEREMVMRVFTTRVDTIFGVTFCVIAPEHPLVETLLGIVDPTHADAVRAYREAARTLGEQDRLAVNRDKTGVFLGAFAINPANGEQIPIWVADYVLMGYGTGAIMAVPGHDERDFEFSTQFGIPIFPVIAPSLEAEVELPWSSKDGVMVNSGEYTGMTVADGQRSLGEWMEALGIGERKVNYKLRDWLISRQRHWGCPIPIIHGADGELQVVSDDLLPVYLPEVEHYEPSGDGTSPLASIPDFVNVTDRDGKLGHRETDTMGGFACSSWYFLRFCDPHNEHLPFDYEKAARWMPVDCYVGGAEHAVMHLLYARFWTKVLFDAGVCPVSEPFQRLLNQGMVLAPAPYRAPRPGETLAVGEEGVPITFEEAASLPEGDVFFLNEKMSKSRGNVVTPEEAADLYGVDALRVYELFVAPFERDVVWSTDGIQGIVRYLGRVFRLVSELQPRFDPDWRAKIGASDDALATRVRRTTHKAILKATDDIERFAFNTYISAMMIMVNELTEAAKEFDGSTEAQVLAFSEATETLILLLAPAAPFACDELWESIGRTGFTYEATWPVGRPELALEESIQVAVQVNGKLRDTLSLPADASDADLEVAALASTKIQANIEGKTVRKVIVVPKKLVNLVVA